MTNLQTPRDAHAFGLPPAPPLAGRRNGGQPVVGQPPFCSPAGGLVTFPADEPPLLLVIVDAEEEFDWRRFSSAATSVTTMRHQHRAHRIFDRYRVVPTYVTDYPVATQPEGSAPLRELLADGRCEIGAHLHPWVNPPLAEEVCPRNSFPGNLPADLERAKLARLTEAIEEHLGCRPLVYRAGRFGAGPNTAAILASLGYLVDTSVMPKMDFSQRHGPDYGGFTAAPFWLGPPGDLLEIPATAGIVGRLDGYGARLHGLISRPLGLTFKVPSLFARLGLLNRISLTPEGVPLAEAMDLTRSLHAAGQRVFAVTYHSPSLEPGHTDYVQTARDLTAFLEWLEGYCAFFMGEMGGRPATPLMVRARAVALVAEKAAAR